MSTIVLRSVKGSPLTNAEVDSNFSNLNTDKLEAATTATLTNKTINLTNNTLVATSAQLAAALTDETGTGSAVFSASPALTGTPTAPTAAAATNTTQIATTAHVFAERSNTATLTNKTITGGTVNPTTLTENGSPAVVQTDIGTAPNEIPLNQYLGNLAYQDAANIAGPVGVGGALSAAGGYNGTVGATTANTGAFTTLSATGVTTVQAGTAAAPAITTSGDTNTGIFFPAADTIAFTEGGVEAMRIDSSGRVGIGTTSPANKLDVVGSAATVGRVATTGDSAATLEVSRNNGAVIARLQTATSEAWVGSANNVPFAFRTNNIERMRITSAGNLLVGLTSATGVALLQVSGPIRTTGYTVATLPAGTVGMRTYVTDALAPSFGVTVSGGGAVTIPVFYDGANWIVA